MIAGAGRPTARSDKYRKELTSAFGLIYVRGSILTMAEITMRALPSTGIKGERNSIGILTSFRRAEIIFVRTCRRQPIGMRPFAKAIVSRTARRENEATKDVGTRWQRRNSVLPKRVTITKRARRYRSDRVRLYLYEKPSRSRPKTRESLRFRACRKLNYFWFKTAHKVITNVIRVNRLGAPNWYLLIFQPFCV